MASDEIDVVVKMLRETNPMAGATIPEMRAAMEAASGVMLLPDDIETRAVKVGVCNAEWTTTPGWVEGRAVLYFHGGGYTIGSIATHRQVVADISRASKSRVLSLDYRLAPEHPHPAAVEDALAAYRAMLDEGIDPSKIAIAGDSAGGGLTAAALVAIRDAGLPRPAAGVCISPWLDLSQSGASYREKAEVDPLVTREVLDMMSAAYLDGQDPKTPLASPLFAKHEDLPPILIQVGTAEVLLDDSVQFEAAVRRAGVDVELDVWEDMIHVWHAFGALLPESGQAIAKIGDYLEGKFAS